MEFVQFIKLGFVIVLFPILLAIALVLYIRRSRDMDPLWFAVPCYIFGLFLSMVFHPDTDHLKILGRWFSDGANIVYGLVSLAGLISILRAANLKARPRTGRGFPVLPPHEKSPKQENSIIIGHRHADRQHHQDDRPPVH